jgi:hypothetical protein
LEPTSGLEPLLEVRDRIADGLESVGVGVRILDVEAS